MFLSGCYFNRDIDETIETERYSLRMVSDKVLRDTRDLDGDLPDSVREYWSTVPEMAQTLATLSSVEDDDHWMYMVDNGKQSFLPQYSFFLSDRTPQQAEDYTPLLLAMMDKGILRADTSQVKMRLLEVFDTARFNASARMCTPVENEEDGETQVFSIVVHHILHLLRNSYSIPVAAADGLDLEAKVVNDMSGSDWKSDSLWLERVGMRLADDPQGRKANVVVFNRQKGKI